MRQNTRNPSNGTIFILKLGKNKGVIAKIQGLRWRIVRSIQIENHTSNT